MIQERLELARERVNEIVANPELQGNYGLFFQNCATYIQSVLSEYDAVCKEDFFTQDIEMLRMHNQKLYADLLPAHYETCFGNPAFAVAKLGEKLGKLLSFLFAEMHSMPEAVYEKNAKEILIRTELFLEVYQIFIYAMQDELEAPDEAAVRETIYSFICDYVREETEERVSCQLNPSRDFALRIVMDSDLSNPCYLYKYGEYVSKEEEEVSAFLYSLPEETIQKMADTFTEGYRIGFEVGGKDLSKKDTVNIRYHIGFERVIKSAVFNFEKMGLKPILYRSSMSIFHKNIHRIGYMGAEVNRQYYFDHKDDRALFMDTHYVGLKLEALKASYEANRELASLHGGPACMETFGETLFEPVSKKEAYALTDEQQKLAVEFASKQGALVNEYIKGEERSFTIIAFPMPAIGPKFSEIFEETIRVNTLDYMLYRNLQQIMIDALDEAEYVIVKGKGDNKTDLTIALHPLQDPSKETKFENCVADVNIPVGEIFTSPVLEGTNGTLHVTRVFLEGLEFKNLRMTFQDGMITDYACDNFADPSDGKKLIRDNVLFSHETLPMGEFAIGTNTTAYKMARRFDIARQMPILIAEKTGPHFAVGDTCYSHSEDLAVYNPDKKEIIARDNACSLLRKTDAAKAYFNCHTDITIPYDELGELSGVRASGERIPIIIDGKFAISGCEILNEPLA